METVRNLITGLMSSISWDATQQGWAGTGRGRSRSGKGRGRGRSGKGRSRSGKGRGRGRRDVGSHKASREAERRRKPLPPVDFSKLDHESIRYPYSREPTQHERQSPRGRTNNWQEKVVALRTSAVVVEHEHQSAWLAVIYKLHNFRTKSRRLETVTDEPMQS